MKIQVEYAVEFEDGKIGFRFEGYDNVESYELTAKLNQEEGYSSFTNELVLYGVNKATIKNIQVMIVDGVRMDDCTFSDAGTPLVKI